MKITFFRSFKTAKEIELEEENPMEKRNLRSNKRKHVKSSNETTTFDHNSMAKI